MATPIRIGCARGRVEIAVRSAAFFRGRLCGDQAPRRHLSTFRPSTATRSRQNRSGGGAGGGRRRRARRACLAISGRTLALARRARSRSSSARSSMPGVSRGSPSGGIPRNGAARAGDRAGSTRASSPSGGSAGCVGRSGCTHFDLGWGPPREFGCGSEAAPPACGGGRCGGDRRSGWPRVIAAYGAAGDGRERLAVAIPTAEHRGGRGSRPSGPCPSASRRRALHVGELRTQRLVAGQRPRATFVDPTGERPAPRCRRDGEFERPSGGHRCGGALGSRSSCRWRWAAPGPRGAGTQERARARRLTLFWERCTAPAFDPSSPDCNRPSDLEGFRGRPGGG
jgi:hypothetical protein